MARFTTIVTVISHLATELVMDTARAAANVSGVVLPTEDAEQPSDRRAAAWADAERHKSVYTLTDFDPLQPVIEAWAARLQGRDNDLAIVAGLATGALAEYVLVTEELDEPVVHWYLGLLKTMAPQRIIAITPTPGSILDALSHLRPERAFPDAATVARAALSYVPTSLSAPDHAGQRVLSEAVSPIH
jgi:hypothetical protein